MATNYVQPGKILSLTAPYQRNSGQAALIGAIVGVALQTIANAAVGPFAVVGVFTHAKTSAEAWTEGAKIYWDNTNKVFTTTSSGNTLCGVAVAAAANPSSTGIVRLDGVAR